MLDPRKPISVRLDSEAGQALELIAGQKLSRSEAIRQALLETAARRKRQTALAAEAKRLVDDPKDRAEIAEVVELMEELRAPR